MPDDFIPDTWVERPDGMIEARTKISGGREVAVESASAENLRLVIWHALELDRLQLNNRSALET